MSIRHSTSRIAVGPIELDVEMARKHGWTEEQITRAWGIISEVSRMESQIVGYREGKTRQCPSCECWSLPGTGPCERCKGEAHRGSGRDAQKKHRIRYTRRGAEVLCACGWRPPNNDEYGDAEDLIAQHIAQQREG